MSTVKIELPTTLTGLRPGGKLAGLTTWTGDKPHASIEIRLFWMVSGVSPRQVCLVEKQILAKPAQVGSHRFEFLLPQGPWSFRGELVKVNWFVEIVSFPSLANARCGFVLSPTGDPIAGLREEVEPTEV